MRKKILLVDDSQTSLMAVGAMLRSFPIDVVTAQDGEEALAVARREQPDVVLMDVIMPKLSGFHACKALRACPETSETPIILVTGQRTPDDLENGYGAGASDYIIKPVDRLELVAKLRCYIDLDEAV